MFSVVCGPVHVLTCSSRAAAAATPSAAMMRALVSGLGGFVGAGLGALLGLRERERAWRASLRGPHTGQ